ncbi:MAG: hypothetical protein ACLFMO_00835 [Eubacteriales bacterium]
MLNKLFYFLKRNSTILNIIILICIFILLQIVFQLLLIPNFSLVTYGDKIIDFKVFYNYNELYQSINEYSIEAYEIYNYIQVIDLLFPLTYGLLFSLSLARFVHRKRYYIVFFPLVGMICDYIENIGIFYMRNRHPLGYKEVSYITQFFTISKFFFLVSSITFIFIFIFFSYISNKKKEDI